MPKPPRQPVFRIEVLPGTDVLEDGRGRKIRLIQPFQVDPALRAVAWRATWQSLPVSARYRLAARLVVDVIVLAAAALIVTLAIRSSGRYGLFGLSAFLMLTAGMQIWLSWRTLRAGRESQVAARLVAGGCCASCGYDISGAAEEPDGCRVCPECGAAWKM